MEDGSRVVPVGRARTAAVALMLVGGMLATGCGAAKGSDSQAGPTTTGLPASVSRPNTSGPDDATDPRTGGKLVLGLEGDAEGLDPTRYAFAASGHFIASAVFEPLATLDADGKPVPYLASRIAASANNTTWTIEVPEGLTFSDGDVLDAAAVKQNLDAHRESIITKAALVTVDSIEQPSPTTVVVTLSQPWAAFPTVMSSQIGYVISPKMLADPELNRTPIGSGPFVYDSRADGERWTFRRNTNYRRSGRPYLDSIEFAIVGDETERLTDLQDGVLDMIQTNRPDQVLSLRSGTFKLVDYAGGEEDFIIVNHARPPFDNKDARLAAAYAIDSERWRKEIMKDVEQPANSPFAPGQPGYEADNGFPSFDLAKAKEHVAAYEKATGKKLSILFQTVDNPGVQADAQFFKANLEAAGMTVELQANKQIGLVAQTATGNYDLSLFRNFGFQDPDTDTVFWRPSSAPPMPGVALNFPRFTDPRVDEAIDQATGATSPEDRDAAYRKLGRIFAEEIPYIWLGRTTTVLAANIRVNGMYEAANGSLQTLGGKTWLGDLWVAA